ncbi:hypothetical protein BC962_1539 [Gillisia mitskevichiae]|uniref:Uncharacterized protein n=1 Tax=Gillisia mitskevichiae TaxID=270921 RepID=A0A495PX13_9FLAO|nr:hypothetical protein [Gillisia mitskevichiae]RKS53289.1 hypothetical protein BC962_1539 [Gillisia mitskevichiae]
MELNDLRILLQKYEEGNTSLQEELDLKKYFSSNEIPSEFMAYKHIFNFNIESKKIAYSNKIQLKSSPKRKWAYAGIAASILIVMSFLFFNDLANKKIEDQNLGTIEDPEQAYLKTKETLKMVADVFSEGREDLEYLNEFNKTKNKFIKEQ